MAIQPGRYVDQRPGPYFCLIFFIILLLLPVGPVPRADDYHSINGFFGERASGLGGAFTAVSDDPSGAIYNPAGLAFADGSSLSITASTYRITNKTFEGVLGPGQDYSLKAENFIPNFLGALTNLGEFKFAFSLLSPAIETFNQADQIIAPLYFPTAAQATAELTDQNTNIMAGPSLAWSFSERFSMGASLFFFTDSSLQTESSTLVQFNGSFGQTAGQDSRVTRGFVPTLGLMYMPTDKTSLGVSVRTTLVTSAKRRVSDYITSGGSVGSLLAVSLATPQMSAGTTNTGLLALGPGASGKVPETSEVRFGWAWFPSQNLMLSSDIIHTTGFTERSNRTEFVPGANVVIFNDDKDPFLERKATTNLAFGVEYYATDNLVLRFGLYTNFSNNEEIVQRQTLISAAIAQNAGPLAAFGAGIVVAQVGDSLLGYRIPELSERPRTEWVHTYGMTIGFGWADANSSIGINLGLESGRGRGIITTELPASPLRYNSLFFYLVASTRR